MSNSTTKSKDSQSDFKLFILHLSNGTIVIGHIIDEDKNLIYVHFPMQLSVSRDSDGDFVGFTLMPYLIPFADFSLNSVVHFNMHQVVSFSVPSEETVDQYIKILKNQYENEDSDDKIDLSSMEIPIVRH